jgi:hypothetical protein
MRRSSFQGSRAGRVPRAAAPLLVLVLLAAAGCSGGDGTDDPGGPPDVVDPGPAPDATPADIPDDAGRDVPAGDLPPADVPDAPPADAPSPDAPDPADLPRPEDPGVDAGPPVPTFPIVTAGASEHLILVAADASPSEHTAANEIRDHFLQATGVELPIVNDPPPGVASLIVVGQGNVARSLGVDPEPADLGEQGFQLKAVPPNVVIAGTPGAGTLYGAHRFLEIALDVRWIAPGETIVPPATDVGFPEEMDVIVQPDFLWRLTSYEWPGQDDAFRARMTMNGGSAGPDDPWGLEHEHDGRAHSYFRFVSPDEFFDTHPEYFSEIGGVRIREETQLCLTNPDVLEIVTERMLARMASMPGVRQHNFSQKDYYNYCQCEHCSAMNELYGTAGGTQFWFVNELAKRTSEVYPDKLIGTLAYMYTEEPPVGMEMHPNVAVWLCHMYPSCDAHPIRTCPENADYKRRAQAWSQIADHLYMWHYIVDFMHYYNPFPNLFALADNLRFYKEIGVEGLYLQGMGHDGGGGEFSLLRPYFAMQLARDSSQDPDRLIRDWLKDYYGAAWGPIHDWIHLLQDKVDSENIHMHLYTNPAQGYLPEDVVVAGEALFDEAEALVAADAVLLDRVQVARMPLKYARFFPRNGYRFEDGFLRWNPGMLTYSDVVDFVDQMTSHGFLTMREAQGSADTMTLLYLILGVDQEVRTIRNAHLEVDVVPGLAGRALRITHRGTGHCVTAYDRRAALFYPFNGGLEDRIGGVFEFFGWVEPGAASQVSERGLTIKFTTFDGLEVTRRMELDETAPILRVTTAVRNPKSSAVETAMRHHFEADLGDLATTRVSFTARDGTVVDKDMAAIIAGQREGEHYRDQDTPAGAWTFTGSKGLRLTQRFPDADVDFTWLYAYPTTLGELEIETWTHRRVLQPGESLTLAAEYEIAPGNW